jgi:hypothetical protein
MASLVLTSPTTIISVCMHSHEIQFLIFIEIFGVGVGDLSKFQTATSILQRSNSKLLGFEEQDENHEILLPFLFAVVTDNCGFSQCDNVSCNLSLQ